MVMRYIEELDDPWVTATDRAAQAGKLLARVLLAEHRRNKGTGTGTFLLYVFVLCMWLCIRWFFVPPNFVETDSCFGEAHELFAVNISCSSIDLYILYQLLLYEYTTQTLLLPPLLQLLMRRASRVGRSLLWAMAWGRG